jgi:3-deoxy-manno-octulosonate cytidylyltransferase (CMP-KDO synthetase)
MGEQSVDTTIILIPARMEASRLPGKPLALINGVPMIEHVWRRAVAAGAGEVAVATDSREIADVITTAGGRAVMTGSHHKSGSDRIYEALERLDPTGKYEIIINVQGDLPTLEPALLAAVVAPLANRDVDISTLAAPIRDSQERTNPNVVKAVAALDGIGSHARALYFTRATAPYGDGPLYHHIGIYAYRRAALARFVALPPSTLEQREKLEQLRALEDNMRIDVVCVDTTPLGVDTPPDLEKAKQLLAGEQ